MRELIQKISIASAVVALIAVLFVPLLSTNAQEAQTPGNGFRINPVRDEKVVNPDEKYSSELTITNPTNSDIDAEVIINDFGAGDAGNGEPKIYYDENTSAEGNSFKTIASAPGSVYIKANSEAKITVDINVTKDTNPGGYYGVVRVVPKNEGSQNVSLAASVGTLFLITVPGNLTESAEITQFTAAKKVGQDEKQQPILSNGRFFINSGEFSVVTSIKNNGNIHVQPFGKVQVTDRSGKVIEEFEFNDKQPFKDNVLPGQERDFINALQAKGLVGQYTITANLGYGTGGSLMTAKTTFWVIPAWFLVLVVAILIALIIGGFMLYRKFSLSNKHKARPRR
jgi:hypothetical protein